MRTIPGVRWWVPAGGLLACATLVTAGFGWTISEATRHRSEQALETAGIEGVSVANDYRDVTLTGPIDLSNPSMAAVRTVSIVLDITYLVEGAAAPPVPTPTPCPSESVSPSPSAEPSPTPSPTTPADDVEAVLPEPRTLGFAFGSAELTAASTASLDALAGVFLDALAVEPSLRLSIAAHTDAVGTDAFNQWLSDARAAAVLNYLIAEGVPGGSLVSTGYGESRPVAPNENAAGRAANRRVEITILEG